MDKTNFCIKKKKPNWNKAQIQIKGTVSTAGKLVNQMATFYFSSGTYLVQNILYCLIKQ